MSTMRRIKRTPLSLLSVWEFQSNRYIEKYEENSDLYGNTGNGQSS